MNTNFFVILSNLNKIIITKSWRKSSLFVEQTTVPIIKIKSSDKYRNLQIDISMQDNKHFGLKCVELVKSFVKEYEALEPLTLSLKNLIKNAKLNDPFMVNSNF